MEPPAPARFSTTSGWPSWLAMRSNTMRGITSVALPAPNGITARIGRSGHASARALGAQALDDAASKPSKATKEGGFMRFLRNSRRNRSKNRAKPARAGLFRRHDLRTLGVRMVRHLLELRLEAALQHTVDAVEI